METTNRLYRADRPDRFKKIFETIGAIGTIGTIVWKPGLRIISLWISSLCVKSSLRSLHISRNKTTTFSTVKFTNLKMFSIHWMTICQLTLTEVDFLEIKASLKKRCCKKACFKLMMTQIKPGFHMIVPIERALNLGITAAFWDMFGSLRSSASCESGFHLIACKFSRSPQSSGSN